MLVFKRTISSGRKISGFLPGVLIQVFHWVFWLQPFLLIAAGSPISALTKAGEFQSDSFAVCESRMTLISYQADRPGKAAENRFFRVLRVIDGDSLEVEGVGEVRLIGVDTPELYHPLKPVQFFAREASEYVKNILGKSRVRLEYDQEKVDKYGRTLAYVYLEDGCCLNEEIIKNGYGFALLRFPFQHLMRYRALEDQARKKGVGLWRNLGLDEFRWILSQETIPYEVFEMANNWWGVRYREYVRLRLTADELQRELLNLRLWTSEFSPSDLERTLLANGWLKLNR